MTNFQILCTGNPAHRGIAQAVSRLFPTAKFISRSNGYDLSTETGLDKLKIIIKDYNVLINNAYVDSGVQETILKLAHESWKTGHVFNIGSISEHSKYSWADPEYAIEKQKLRELSLELGDEKFKTTHMVVGGFQAASTGSDNTMDPLHIAKTIQWVLNAEFQVPVIGVEQMTDHIREYFNKQREND